MKLNKNIKIVKAPTYATPQSCTTTTAANTAMNITTHQKCNQNAPKLQLSYCPHPVRILSTAPMFLYFSVFWLIFVCVFLCIFVHVCTFWCVFGAVLMLCSFDVVQWAAVSVWCRVFVQFRCIAVLFQCHAVLVKCRFGEVQFQCSVVQYSIPRSRKQSGEEQCSTAHYSTNIF